MRMNLDPNIKPETQHANPIKGCVIKLHISQGRVGLKGKRSDHINQTINPTSELSQKIPGETKIETGKTNRKHSKDLMHFINNADKGMAHTRPLTPDVPFHPGPLTSTLLNPLDQTCQEVRKVHKILIQISI